MFGRLLYGELEIAREVLYTETEQIFNATEEMWLAHGWKIVVVDECLGDGYVSSIEETGTQILVHWVIAE